MMLLIIKMTVSQYLLLQIVTTNMGGIDKSDQILYAYLDERKSLQWTKKVNFNLLMRLVMNSYILYKLNTQKALN